MIIFPKNAELMAWEFTGLFVNVEIEDPEPIRVALASHGGTITMLKFMSMDQMVYIMTYKTIDNRIELRVGMSHNEYFYNLEFFGGSVTEYDSPILFNLDGKKFVMP